MLVTANLMLINLLLSAPPARQPPSDVVARARAALPAVVAGDFAGIEEQFTPDMRVAQSSGRLAATWTNLVNRAGAFRSCAPDPRVRRIADKQMVITACAFERATVDVQIAFDRDGRIAGFAFRPSASAAVPYTVPSYASPESVRRDGNDDRIG